MSLLHGLLASSAGRSPGRLALATAARTLTYRELDEDSNRLARLLLGQGVAKGDRVGIYLEKSIEAIVAVFGILKCGAAYVPVDPAAPARRAAYVLNDCRVRALITSGERGARLAPDPAAAPWRTILAEGGASWSGLSAAAPPDAGTREADLAYILYTSGSTGEPKGVMLSHRAAMSFVRWAADYLGLQPEDRLANHAPLHFDLSVFDVFGAVSAGAAVLPVPAAVGLFPRSLADWIEASAISVWYSVPSVLAQLALRGGLERHRFARLKKVLFAGEVFPKRHLRRLAGLLPGASFYNLYGPTETNVCTVHAVTEEDLRSDEPLPIGRACAGDEVLALGEDGGPVAPGRTGELCVRGPTLMDGYWGRGRRVEAIYRTGDLVRMDESGRYHFLGRRDAQVKSRGYRIELGEVEAVLCRHPAVAEAAVVADPHEELGCTLRALVVPREPGGLNPRELSAFCAERLPPYMVPALFELRAQLPRTSTGKLDRQALRGR